PGAGTEVFGWHALRYSAGRGVLASGPRPAEYLRACHPRLNHALEINTTFRQTSASERFLPGRFSESVSWIAVRITRPVAGCTSPQRGNCGSRASACAAKR